MQATALNPHLIGFIDALPGGTCKFSYSILRPVTVGPVEPIGNAGSFRDAATPQLALTAGTTTLASCEYLASLMLLPAPVTVVRS
jgi:hypothetical protein